MMCLFFIEKNYQYPLTMIVINIIILNVLLRIVIIILCNNLSLSLEG